MNIFYIIILVIFILFMILFKMSSNNEEKDTFTSETTSSETTSSETTSSTTLNPVNSALSLRQYHIHVKADDFYGTSSKIGINTEYRSIFNNNTDICRINHGNGIATFNEFVTIIKTQMEIEEDKKKGLNTYYNLDFIGYIKVAKVVVTIMDKNGLYRLVNILTKTIDGNRYDFDKQLFIEDLNDNERTIYNNIIKNGLDTPETNKILDTLGKFVLYLGNKIECSYVDIMDNLFSGYNMYMYTACEIVNMELDYNILKERATDAYNKLVNMSEDYLDIYENLSILIEIANKKIFNSPLRQNIDFNELTNKWNIIWGYRITHNEMIPINYAIVLQLATNIAFNYKIQAELTAEEAYNKLTESEKAIYDEMKK